MGSFAKRLGQLSRASLETESANILKTAGANKIGLSKALDATLKQGHDMTAFGLGTMASMASVGRYARFTASMHGLYAAMETQFDGALAGSPTDLVWSRHGDVLRRAVRLAADLRDVGDAGLSPATRGYVDAIVAAGRADADGGGRMLGHLYCRYFADLFGGQMLAGPYNVALGLDAGTPRHYAFDFPGTRREFIEDVYASLNEAGDALAPNAQAAVVEEALAAFRLNVGVYSEEPVYLDAAKGAGNLVAGGARRLFG